MTLRTWSLSFNEQDYFTAARRGVGRNDSHGSGRWLPDDAREVDVHLRPAIDLAGDIDTTTVLLDDSVDRCEADASADPCGLCRVEGHEGILEGHGIHAVPGVGHAKPDIYAGQTPVVFRAERVVECHVGRGHRDHAAVHDGVTRIHDEVEDDLVEL